MDGSQNISVYIVDDNPDDLEWMADLAGQAEATEVAAFADVSPMIERLDQDVPELIILDYMLDGKTGLAFVPAIRIRAPDAKIAMVSGVAFLELQRLAPKFGVHYLTKGMLSEDYIARLLAVLPD